MCGLALGEHSDVTLFTVQRPFKARVFKACFISKMDLFHLSFIEVMTQQLLTEQRTMLIIRYPRYAG